MRRFLQFRISTLLWLLLVLAVGLGWWRDHVNLKKDLERAELRRQVQRLVWDHTHHGGMSISLGEDRECGVFVLSEFIAGWDKELAAICPFTYSLWDSDDPPRLVLWVGREKHGIAIPTPGAIPKLTEVLANNEREDVWKRASAACTLGQMGENAVDAIPALRAAIEDDEDLVRMNAVYALGMIGKKSHEAVPALIQLLGDAHKGVRRNSAVALWRIGLPEAKDALRPVLKLLRDADPEVRMVAMTAVTSLANRDEACAVITRTFTDERHGVAKLHAAKLMELLDSETAIAR